MTPTENYDNLINLTVVSAVDSLDRFIAESKGEPQMSPDDIKGALIMTHRALQYQTKINEELTKRVEELEQSVFKKIFRRK